MKQYETINLSDYTYSGEGGQGVAYTHKSEKRLAKLFNPGFNADFAVKEFEMACAAYELGVPTPKPFRLITDGQRVGTEYELIEHKRSFCRIISEEPQRMEEISLRFAEACRKLHSTKADTARIPSMKARMRDFYATDGVAPAFFAEEVLRLLEQIPDTPCCLHGDMQIGNIITDGKRTLWIDIGQFAYGAPEWDLGLCWRISQMTDNKMLDHLFHLTSEQMQPHWNLFAPAYYGIAPESIGEKIRKMMPYFAIKAAYMHYLTRHQPIAPDRAEQMLEMSLSNCL